MKLKSTQVAAQWTKRRVVLPVLALFVVGGLGGYELARPATARAAAAVGNAAPIDEGSVSSLLSLDKAMETLAARVTPAVVNVRVTSRVKPTADEGGGDAQQEMPPDMEQFFQQFGFGQGQGQGGGHRQFRMAPQRPQIEHGIGSGIVISPDGYIVTNNHVVDGATDIQVTFSDRRTMPAKLVGTDPVTDLAVIRVDGHNMANIGWGDSTQLHPGQTVLAFGNPLGVAPFTVTRGIVSGLNRPNPFSEDRRKPGEFIQTDAAINQGNSGGPLVDAHGQVIGINTFLISPSGAFAGMGFAIPSQIAKPTVQKLISSGKVEHGYMGVVINDVTPEDAKFFNMQQATGAVVSEVGPDSPASKAGLKVGDVIAGVNGEKVTDAGDLQAKVTEMSPGTSIKLDVMRDGKSTIVPLTLSEYNNQSAKNDASGSEGEQKGRWGVGLSDLTGDVRQQLQIPANVHGAVVMQVQPGSQADNAGLAQGFVIEQVNRKDVSSAADVKNALANIPKGQDVLLLVYTNGGSTFVVMHAPTSIESNG